VHGHRYPGLVTAGYGRFNRFLTVGCQAALVPTLRLITPGADALRAVQARTRRTASGRHSHAERGNEGILSNASLSLPLPQCSARNIVYAGCRRLVTAGRRGWNRFLSGDGSHCLLAHGALRTPIGPGRSPDCAKLAYVVGSAKCRKKRRKHARLPGRGVRRLDAKARGCDSFRSARPTRPVHDRAERGASQEAACSPPPAPRTLTQKRGRGAFQLHSC
jgi:hypothetical protein